MNIAKRNLKENKIIDAAEGIFSSVGFTNAKMEDIAGAARITKVTLYSYFKSKENLYLAITYRAYNLLEETYHEKTEALEQEDGLALALGLMEAFMTFCEQNFLYAETFLRYYALVRAQAEGGNAKLTEGVIESSYFKKLQAVQERPLLTVIKAVDQGKEDGSIVNQLSSTFLTYHAWTMVIGYTKMAMATGTAQDTMYNLDLQKMKQYTLRIVRDSLQRIV
ncbi:MAG: TetR/AcrR family transcriptional regulator [Saprospiraceae bacterium]